MESRVAPDTSRLLLLLGHPTKAATVVASCWTSSAERLAGSLTMWPKVVWFSSDLFSELAGGVGIMAPLGILSNMTEQLNEVTAFWLLRYPTQGCRRQRNR